ncbi:hypothetical protein [Alcaligenes faecalis]|uniref:hypothetical protein n=1 Tax=Alcaligenes faecalis TaxID=511 RepID=UPI0024BC655F|nr:hypothetical protein [Alcaligenes faecalis]WHQ44559.1 hypothetical protein E8D21_13625 [Alcaligenes faecalis]
MSLTSHYRDQKKRRKGLGSVGDTPVYLLLSAYVCLLLRAGQDSSLLGFFFDSACEKFLARLGLELSITDS